MTKPTGRPKGAPRRYQTTDERPFTVSVRVPRPWVEPLKRYAAQHRQSMSELLLDGLRWRCGEGDPRGNGVVLPPAPPHADKPYYENTDEGNMLVREVRELRTLLTEALRPQVQAPTPADPPEDNSTDSVESPLTLPEPPSPVAAALPEMKQCKNPAHPPYDASKAECPAHVLERKQRQRAKEGSAV